VDRESDNNLPFNTCGKPGEINPTGEIEADCPTIFGLTNPKELNSTHYLSPQDPLKNRPFLQIPAMEKSFP